MNRPVSLSIIEDFGIITVSSGNRVNQEVIDGIVSRLLAAEQNSSVEAIILTATGPDFIGRKDADEFGIPDQWRQWNEDPLHPLLFMLENCRKTVICAINGAALGSGLEIALACHYRVATAGAELGQPEIKLGLIPSGGGTQRLPRLAGVAKAAALCSDGNSIGAGEAFRCGILDDVIEGDLLPGCLSFARSLLEKGRRLRKTRDLADKLGKDGENSAVLEEAREQARKRHRGQLAPLKAVDAVEAATQLSFEEGCRRESELFKECLFSDQSKALIHISLSQREIVGEWGDSGAEAAFRVKKAAVVGAGYMGRGIAMAYANAGIPVLLKDESTELLDKGLAAIRRNYETSLEKGRIQQKAVSRRLELINPALSYEGFFDADVIVEAVYEDLQLKQRIFREIAAVCKPEAILATNTSTLDIDQIASASPDPSRVVGHHFFAPANVMQLIEVVRGLKTSKNVIAASVALARRLNKTAVVVRNCRLFAGNRMYYAYQREAQFLVEEGADVQDVDAALFNFGMAMGPFAARDLSGLDVAWRAEREYAELQPATMRRPLVLDRLYKAGRLGQKSGAGWYLYPGGSREPQPDPEVGKIIIECAENGGIPRRRISPAEILERTLYVLINEGARIMGEGIVGRAAALDIIFVMGYGFPAYKGGPMWFADRVGLGAICTRLRQFERRYGPHWAPSPLLARLAEEGKSFADFDCAIKTNGERRS